MDRVLILCTGNSARSQMAEGLLRARAGDQFEIVSAGTRPGTVRSEAILALDELGIDIRSHRSKHVDEFAGQSFRYVITVCDNAREACPIYPADTEMVHWSFEDPSVLEGTVDERLAEFCRIRDQISVRLDSWLKNLSQRRVDPQSPD